MNDFDGLGAQPEDLFREVAYMIDYLLSLQEVNQHIVDGLWVMMVNDIRLWKFDVTNKDKELMAGSVFYVTRKVLGHHAEISFSEKIYDMIGSALEKNLRTTCDDDWKVFLNNLTECSEQLNEWINEYEESESCLSDEIDNIIAVLKDTPKPSLKVEKQRVVDIEKLSSNFKVRGFDKKTHMPVLKSNLEHKQSDKDLARVALMIYESKYFSKQSYSTFSKWYKDFCVIVDCTFHESYEPHALRPIPDSLKAQYYFLI